MRNIFETEDSRMGKVLITCNALIISETKKKTLMNQ